jgi:hypothetical protein
MERDYHWHVKNLAIREESPTDCCIVAVKNIKSVLLYDGKPVERPQPKDTRSMPERIHACPDCRSA